MEKLTNLTVTKKAVVFSANQILPLMVEPVSEKFSLVDWVTAHRHEFETDLLKYGAILFRGFEIDTLQAFKDFVECFDSEPIPYMFRSSPRHELDKNIENIYTSTIYPKRESIIMHNESSYSRNWGMKIVFCCLQPAEEGGETPLADSRRVLSDIPAELAEKFRAKGIMYRRRLVKNQSMSWQEVFQTDDKKQVENVCGRNDIQFYFHSEDHLDLEWVQDAIHKHPETGEETWFNHAYFFNKYSRYTELGVGYDSDLPEEFIFTDTLFGDGTPISIPEYEAVKKAYMKNKIQFSYQKGDVVFLDNMLTAHGRNPYKGDRTIATAIMEPNSVAALPY